MRTIQVTGLPGTGKTTGIIDFLKKVNSPLIQYLDLKDFSGKNREIKLYNTVLKTKSNLIIESACGISRIPSFVIRVDQPLQNVYERLKHRDGQYDPDYLSLISGEMITPDCTIYRAQDLPALLHQLF